ncbi:MAG: hypothetical protein R3351_09275 [Nitrospirales bacterium]|nr:hypothetical protein [Nitrospirales bacterium]
MKLTTFANEKWDCIEKGMKIFEEVFLGVFVIGMIFLLYGWMNLEQISLAALVQFLFVSSWIGIFGLVAAVTLPVLFALLGKKLCRE